LKGGDTLDDSYILQDKVMLTIKLKLHVTSEQQALFLKTMDSYRDALNYTSRYVFNELSKRCNKRKLNDLLYSELRSRFGLGAQMAQSVIRKVSSTYQGEWTKIRQNAEHRKNGHTKKYYRGLNNPPALKSRTTEMVYGRDYSLGKDYMASLLTLEGRVRVQYEGWEKHLPLLNLPDWKVGSAKLWYDKRKKQLYLTVPVCKQFDIDINSMTKVQGVDVGMRYLAVVDTGAKPHFVKGSEVQHKKRHFQKLRSGLQMKGTRSARRRLVAISQRERRFISDVNHRISSQIASPQVLTGIEDLTHIRERISTKRRDKEMRRQAEQWSFADLHEKIIYKSTIAGGYATRQDAHYSSQACPMCGHTSKANRPNKGLLFTCGACNYTLHADLVGARNMRNRTLIARQDRAITGRLSTVPYVDSDDTGPDPAEESHNPLTLVRGS
jgi:IS605 OrfB family transposase